jgi:hypothetical protein
MMEIEKRVWDAVMPEEPEVDLTADFSEADDEPISIDD